MDKKRKLRIKTPPRWADRFLEWYCRPDLLEEIQGDAHELFFRDHEKHPLTARLRFCWNVLRFFRWRNIRRSRTHYRDQLFSTAMLKNVLLVSLRNFLRQPGHTALNVAGLSIAFCCTLLIILWVNHEFSFDRFHRDPERIYKVISHVQSDGSYQTFDAASAAINISTIPEVEQLITVSQGSRWPHTLCFRAEQKNGECIYLNGVYASTGFFSVFNFPVIEGDQNPLRDPSGIAISESMAMRLYGSESAVGKSLRIDNHIPVTVTSVFEDAPAYSSLSFEFVMPFSVLKKQWGINDEQLAARFFPTFIKTGSFLSASDLTYKLNREDVLTLDLKEHNVRYEAYPLTDWRLHSLFENGRNSGGRITYINLFLIIGGLVLLLAVINYINMTTARATTRAREIGIRKVTGARKTSIVLQFLSESFLLVTVAFGVAVIMAQLALPFFTQVVGEPLDGNWLSGKLPLLLLAVLFVVALASGIYPAFVMSSFEPAKILKNQISAGGTGPERLRKSLLILQIAASLIILNFAGVIHSQMDFIHHKNPGFEYANMLRIEPTATLFRNFDVFKNELKKDPAVISVGCSNLNPVGSEGHNTGVNWNGKLPDSKVTFQTIGCSWEFPETIGLSVIEGKGFTATPVDSAFAEVLVTSDAAKTMNMDDPVGQVIEIHGKKHAIVGVVNDFHTESFHRSRLPVLLYRTDYMHTAAVYVRYRSGTTEQTLGTVKAAYKAIEPSFTMKYWFQNETFDELYKTEKTVSSLILILTFITLVIAIIGVVGLATFNVLRKRKEISVRRVFGASIVQIMSLLGKEFTLIMIFAVAIAVPVSWVAASDWLTGFVYHVDLPLWMFPTSFGAIAIISLTIICMQGLKTIRTNPTETLRRE